MVWAKYHIVSIRFYFTNLALLSTLKPVIVLKKTNQTKKITLAVMYCMLILWLHALVQLFLNLKVVQMSNNNYKQQSWRSPTPWGLANNLLLPDWESSEFCTNKCSARFPATHQLCKGCSVLISQRTKKHLIEPQ